MLSFSELAVSPWSTDSVHDRLAESDLADCRPAQVLRGRVHLSGAFRVILSDGRELAPTSALRQAVLAVLALSPGQARSRRSLQALFWGDSDAGRAAASLRNTLYLLRQDLAALGPDILQGDRLAVRLQHDRLVCEEWQPGPAFLEGLDLGLRGCEGFEEWLRLNRSDPAADAVPAVARPADPAGAAASPTRLPRLALLCPRLADGRPSGRHLAGQVMAELASGLAAWRSFAVLAPHSSFAVDEEFGIPQDNRILRADYCLSGRLHPAPGEDSRIDLRFIHLASREILWSGRFPLSPGLIGPALDRFTARIVSSVADRLEEHQRILLGQRTDPSALLCYLTGRLHQHRSDLPHVRKARAAFQQALSINPGFAPAHARIAETLYGEWVLRCNGDDSLLEAAALRAQHAIRLNPTDATGHWVGGAVALYRRRFDEVAEAFATAEDLAPHDAGLILEHGDALSHLADHAAAERRFCQSLDLNPLPPDNLWWIGASIAFHAGDFALAAARCDRMRDADAGLGLRAVSYAMAGRLAEAGHWAARLEEALPGLSPETLSDIPPNRDRESYRRNYVEGLRLARSVSGGQAWRISM